MDTNLPLPIPLFDTLAHLKQQPAKFPELIIGVAQLDYQHAINFLYHYRGSLATFNAYRREIERYLQWCWLVQKKSLIQMNRMDFEAFIEFCQSPPKHWIGIKQADRFIEKDGLRLPHPEWRPFVASVSKKAYRDGKTPNIKNYALSNTALQAIFSILNSFYHYLEQEEYALINPIAQIRQKSKFIRKRQQKTPVRRLSELQWTYVIETAEIMAEENACLHERTLFIMNALFGMYLRISELAAHAHWEPQMGHFFKDIDDNWWFKTVGKGNKERDISVSHAMLNALKRYRMSLNLSALPTPGENFPLISKVLGRGPITDTRQIRNIVQECFDKAIERLKQDGFLDEAETLLSATVHWLRHTGISEDVKIRPREHVRDDAGHSSSAITDRYIDIELRARHDSAKKKLIKYADGSPQQKKSVEEKQN
jgi:site-specific recombinase XerD